MYLYHMKNQLYKIPDMDEKSDVHELVSNLIELRALQTKTIDYEKSMKFSLLRSFDKWRITFAFVVREVPATELDPCLDNSITQFGVEEVEWLDTDRYEEMKENLFNVLDKINDYKIITE